MQNVLGADISPTAIEKARARLGEEISFVCFDILKDDSAKIGSRFDLVIVKDVI